MRNQAKRAALFERQNQTCPLCERTGATMTGWAHKPNQNVLICKRCNTTLGNYLKGLADGVTPSKMDAFLARGPAPEPTISDQAVKLKPAQLDSLLACISDRSALTLAEWCGRAGVTEDEAIQYARQHGSTLLL